MESYVCRKEFIKYSLHICIGLFYVSTALNILDYIFTHIEIWLSIAKNICMIMESLLLFSAIVSALSENTGLIDLPFTTLNKVSTYHTKLIMNCINTVTHLLKTKRALFKHTSVCVDSIFEEIDIEYLQKVQETTTNDLHNANRQLMNTARLAYQGVVTRSMAK
jgi:hypothetical protein